MLMELLSMWVFGCRWRWEMGCECQRMGQLALEELKRYLVGEPLRYRITPGIFVTMA